MLSILKNISNGQKAKLRKFGHKFGLDIRLNNLNARNELRLPHFLKNFGINLVLDVGANRGQFAEELYEAGYDGKVVSFEALPGAHDLLRQAAARRKELWSVAPRVALSDQAGMAKFHVTAVDQSSSLFAPTEHFIASTDQANPAGTIEVATARLDEVVKDLDISVDGCFLKMDVQGSEPLVMAGAPNILASAKGLSAEVSLTPLYEGQPSTKPFLEAIYEAGFEIWDIWPGFRDPQTHRLYQADIICFRRDAKIDS